MSQNNVSHVQIRYNTKAGDSGLFWRVIIDGKEYLATDVAVTGALYSEESTVDGVTKYNLACDGTVSWKNTTVVIEA